MTVRSGGRPLAGRRIVVTRRPEQAGALAARLEALGADVIELPAVAVAPPEDLAPLDAALRQLAAYDWLVFTSANAAGTVADRLDALGLASSVGRDVAIASVGPATSEAIRSRFPDAAIALQPEGDFSAEGLASALASRNVRGRRFLLPLSNKARPVVRDAILAAGGLPDTVIAYRTVAPPQLREQVMALLRQRVDLVTLASPSAVDNLKAAAGDVCVALPVAVIGPVTERAARAAGFTLRAVAQPSTAEGLVDAIVRLFSAQSA